MSWGFNRVNVGIDLRSELDTLFNGNDDIVPIGQWIILRRYDIGSKSIYYNDVTKEGVGGPKWNYTDELHKAYIWNSWIADPFVETQTPAGMYDVPLVTIFMEYDVDPKDEDEIYEFDWDDHTIKPDISDIPTPYEKRMNIKSISRYRLDRARKEFYVIRAVKENVRY